MLPRKQAEPWSVTLSLRPVLLPHAVFPTSAGNTDVIPSQLRINRPFLSASHPWASSTHTLLTSFFPHQCLPTVRRSLSPSTDASTLTALFSNLLSALPVQHRKWGGNGGRPAGWHYFYQNFTELSGIDLEAGMQARPDRFVPSCWCHSFSMGSL